MFCDQQNFFKSRTYFSYMYSTPCFKLYIIINTQITDEDTIVSNGTQRYKRRTSADKNTAAIKNQETEDGTTKRFVSLVSYTAVMC